jgi:hypothetical protein
MTALDFFKQPRNDFRDYRVNATFKDGVVDYTRSPDHKHIIFSASPVTGVISYVSIIIAKTYLNLGERTMAQWKKDTKLYYVHGSSSVLVDKTAADNIYRTAYATGKIPYNYLKNRGFYEVKKDNKIIASSEVVRRIIPFRSIDFNYRSIVNYIKVNGYFNPEHFNVPYLEEDWLDDTHTVSYSENITPGGYKLNVYHSLNGYFGGKFPLNPFLNSQGMIVENFLNILLDRIIKNRIKLVENSSNFFSNEWIMDFKDIVNDCISSVDVMLNIIYIKAEYDPLPKWKFDKAKLGDRFGRKMNDKIKWVYAISGNLLNIEAEKKSFDYLREMRNHLSHFDPPCFAITIIDAVNVLNKIIDIGKLHIKIRQTLEVQVSTFLLNFVLQPEVIHNPDPAFINNIRRNVRDGYYTSTWESTTPT